MNRTIVNRTRSYTKGATRLYLDVPDTYGPYYRWKIHDEWKLRIWSEIKDFNASGGKVLFLTLTYDDRNLPYFDLVEDGKSWHLPCFSHEHYESFMKSFRDYFYRKYGLAGPGDSERIVYNKKGMKVWHSSMPVRQIFACEYGPDRKRTQRSHYHALLFVPREYMQTEELSRSESAIVDWLEKEFWKKGFVIRSKTEDGGLYVTSEFAADYVAKYCFKSFQYYQRDDIREFLFNPDGSRNSEHFELMKGKLPTHWQSRFFGLGLTKYFDTYEAFRDGYDFSQEQGYIGDLRKGERDRKRMPLYIQRKLLFDYNKNGDKAYTRNEKGVDWQFRSFVERLKESADKVSRGVRVDQLLSKVSDDDVRRLFADYKADVTIDSVVKLHDYITSILGNRTYEEYILWQRVWKGLVCDSLDSQNSVDDLSFEDFVSESFSQYWLNLTAFRNPSAYNVNGFFTPYRKEGVLNRIMTYDSCNRFVGFVEIQRVISLVTDDYISRCDRKYLERLLERKKLKLEVA